MVCPAPAPCSSPAPRSHMDPLSCGPIQGEQELPVPGQCPTLLSWLRSGLCHCFLYCVDTVSSGILISAFRTESKTKFRKSQLQRDDGSAQVYVGFISLLFALHRSQGQFLATAAHPGQWSRNTAVILLLHLLMILLLLLVNYFISFL